MKIRNNACLGPEHDLATKFTILELSILFWINGDKITSEIISQILSVLK